MTSVREMTTVRELAERNHVTGEAIRKQLRRYKKELEGHVHQQGNMQFLDDEAVEFLQKHRNNNPIVVGQNEKAIQLEQLKEQNMSLMAKIAEQAEKIAAQSEEMLQLERLRLESSEKLRIAEKRASEAELKAQESKAQYERTMFELRRLKFKLKKEQERKLTVKERLFGRR